MLGAFTCPPAFVTTGSQPGSTSCRRTRWPLASTPSAWTTTTPTAATASRPAGPAPCRVGERPPRCCPRLSCITGRGEGGTGQDRDAPLFRSAVTPQAQPHPIYVGRREISIHLGCYSPDSAACHGGRGGAGKEFSVPFGRFTPDSTAPHLHRVREGRSLFVPLGHATPDSATSYTKRGGGGRFLSVHLAVTPQTELHPISIG